jgi:hypothetical protein
VEVIKRIEVGPLVSSWLYMQFAEKMHHVEQSRRSQFFHLSAFHIKPSTEAQHHEE